MTSEENDPIMTVGQLIEELKKQPQDLQVWVFAGERGHWPCSVVLKGNDPADGIPYVCVAAEDCLA